jgi:hypothetical protein
MYTQWFYEYMYIYYWSTSCLLLRWIYQLWVVCLRNFSRKIYTRSKHLIYIVYRKHQIASSLRMLEEEEEEEEEERLYVHLGGR